MAVDLSGFRALAKRLGLSPLQHRHTCRCFRCVSNYNYIPNGYVIRYTETSLHGNFCREGENIPETAQPTIWHPIDRQDFFEERAAILCYDGTLSREEAEYRAALETEAEAARRAHTPEG